MLPTDDFSVPCRPRSCRSGCWDDLRSKATFHVRDSPYSLIKFSKGEQLSLKPMMGTSEKYRKGVTQTRRRTDSTTA